MKGRDHRHYHGQPHGGHSHRHDRDDPEGHHFHGRGRGRHGGGRGRHRERGERMERGALRFILLDALRDGPRHGYDIMKSLEERTDGRYVPSPGTVYPTLQYLEDLGHVRATQKADRRVYEITDSGRAELEGQADRVAAFWSRFGTSPASESLQHEIRFLEEEMENLSRTVFNGLRDVIAREDRETVRTVRSVVERCREEIRGVITDSLSKKESQ